MSRGRARRALRAAKRQAAQKPHDPVYGQTESSKFRKLKRWVRNKIKKFRKRNKDREYNRDDDILSAVDENRKVDKRQEEDTE